MRPSQQPEIDAESARAAAFENDLGVPFPDPVEHPVVALVVLVKPVPHLVTMIGAIAPGARIEVEVELDPVEGVVRDEPVERGVGPFLHGRVAEADVPEPIAVTPGNELGARLAEIGERAEALDLGTITRTSDPAHGCSPTGSGDRWECAPC